MLSSSREGRHKTSRSILEKCASSWPATSHTHPEQPTKNQHAESAPKKERWGQRYGNKFSLQWIWSHTKAGDFQGYVDKSTSDKTPTQSPKRAWNHAPVILVQYAFLLASLDLSELISWQVFRRKQMCVKRSLNSKETLICWETFNSTRQPRWLIKEVEVYRVIGHSYFTSGQILN